MADPEPRNSQAKATDAPATTSGVTNAVAVGVSDVDSGGNIASELDIPSASIVYSPVDLESQRASPFEVGKYLSSQEENWPIVKQEMGLEDRTASLSILEHNRDFQQQPLPSTSSQTLFPPHFASGKYPSVSL